MDRPEITNGIIFNDPNGDWYYWDEEKLKAIGPFPTQKEVEEAYDNFKKGL